MACPRQEEVARALPLSVRLSPIAIMAVKGSATEIGRHHEALPAGGEPPFRVSWPGG